MKVIWAVSARRRFRALLQSAWQQHPPGARRCAAAVARAADELAHFPFRYRDRGHGVRVMPVLGTPYLLHYRIEADHGTVRILLVRHGREAGED